MVFFIPNWIAVSIIVFRLLRRVVVFLVEALLLLAWAIGAFFAFLYRASFRREGDGLRSDEREVPRRRGRDAEWPV